MERNKIDIILSDDKKLTIRKLPLRQAGRLLIVFDTVIGEVFETWENKTNDEIIAGLPKLVSEHMEMAGKLIEVITEDAISAEEALDERGLDDAIKIIMAGISVNNIGDLKNTIKKTMAARKQRAANTEKG